MKELSKDSPLPVSLSVAGGARVRSPDAPPRPPGADPPESIVCLAAEIAHDLNNALAVVLPNIRHAMKTASAEEVAALESAASAAESASVLARRLMFIARTGTDLARSRVDLGATVEATLEASRSVLPPDVNIVAQVAPGTFVEAVVSDIQQVVLNLVINARDALAGTDNPLLHVSVTREGDLAVLTVGDNGTGMSEAVLSRIGEPCFTTKGPSRGNGLGLASAFRILRNNGARIQVRSKPGLGTEFRIEQSCAPAEADPPALPVALPAC